MKIFGKKLDIQTLVIGVVLGLLICCNLFCGCKMMEGATGSMEEPKEEAEATLEESVVDAAREQKEKKEEKDKEEMNNFGTMVEGLKQRIENLKQKGQEGFAGIGEQVMGGVDGTFESQNGDGEWRDGSEETHQGTQVPLPAGEMFFFSGNKFAPQCRSSYSSSTGQACLSKEQIDYLNQRGGNRTHADGF